MIVAVVVLALLLVLLGWAYSRLEDRTRLLEVKAGILGRMVDALNRRILGAGGKVMISEQDPPTEP